MRSERSRSLVLLAALALAACHRGEEKEAAAPVPVRTVPAARRAITEALTAAGPLTPPPGADVKLGALVTGRLAQVTVAEGDAVRQGQVLARIEPTPFRDALAQAQAQLGQARAQASNDARKLERAQTLYKAGIAARQEVDDAQAQSATSQAALKVAEAAVSTAQNQLARTELHAPFDGLVAHVFAAAGEPVDGSGKPVVEVARTEVLELHGVLPATAAAHVQPGQKVRVTVTGQPEPKPGEVLALSPLLDASTGTATVRIRVPNPTRALKGGEMARAEILIDTHQNALAVPEEALVPADQSGGNADSTAAGQGNTLAVETVDAQGRAQRRAIQIGLRGGGFVEVLSGLREGEPVIVQGAYALPDGAAVKVQGSAP